MGHEIKQLISVRNIKKGNYQVVKYIMDGKQFGGNDFEMRTAFTKPYLEYMGDPKWAYRLTNKYGVTEEIQPASGHRKPIEKRSVEQEAKRLLLADFMRDYSFSPTCSIGFNPEEKKWYGWSHRAMYGFTIGSHVKPGDCAYTPFDKEDFIKDSIRFWSDPDHFDVHFDREDEVHGDKGCWIKWTIGNVKNKKIRGQIDSTFCTYPDEYGRGEWTAETLEDAKQMAIDFANGVS